jgi:uncharacterized membrane protein YdjX (TVP38/TMEM64 family)
MSRNIRLVARHAAPFIVLALIVLILRLTGLADMLDEAWLDDHIRGQGLKGWIIFILLGALLCSFGTPRQLVAFFGGYAFGAAAGTLLSTLAALTGCACIYFSARRFGHALVAGRLGQGRLKNIDSYFREAPFLSTVTVRLFPVGNNALFNLLAGMANFPAAAFIAGSGVGYIPQMLVFSLLGSGIQVDTTWRFKVSAVLFLLSCAFGVFLYRRCRRAVRAAASLNETG